MAWPSIGRAHCATVDPMTGTEELSQVGSGAPDSLFDQHLIANLRNLSSPMRHGVSINSVQASPSAG